MQLLHIQHKKSTRKTGCHSDSPFHFSFYFILFYFYFFGFSYVTAFALSEIGGGGINYGVPHADKHRENHIRIKDGCIEGGKEYSPRGYIRAGYAVICHDKHHHSKNYREPPLRIFNLYNQVLRTVRGMS